MKFALLSILLFILPIENSTDQELFINDQEGELIEKVQHSQISFHYFDFPLINEDVLNRLMDDINTKVYRPPINAKIDANGKITDGKPGMILNRNKFNTDVRHFFYEGKPTTIKAPTSTIYPKVNSELLADISVNQIGEYITYYRESNKERSHNITLSTNAINNYVVFPNERFSFNKVVGERTKEKGYLRAPVIVKGEYEEDIGGGICQVSSTLFNAVNLKGIQIVERYSHSRSVPYVPPGKDATVSWWGPDFVFKNKYSHPILIRAKSGNGQMVVKIYSAEDVRYKGD